MQSNYAVNREPGIFPFTIVIASTPELLTDAVKIRQAAYARHLPDVARSMTDVEAWDLSEGAVVLVARAKLDGEPLGTLRIHTNDAAPLPLEQSYALPDALKSARLAEAARFGITADRAGPVVKTALLKAFWLWCLDNDVDHMVITARRPLDRMYERLLFADVDERVGYVPMAHVGGLPHRVMSADVKNAQARWFAAKHPMYEYFVETNHPDIKVTKPAQTSVVPTETVTA